MTYATQADLETRFKQQELIELRSYLQGHGIQTTEFHEPYKDWGLTAISALLVDGERHLLMDLPLWRAA